MKRVIHFSAIGVNREQPSAFSSSKLAGDRALMARDLDWVILRPSVVVGWPVFGASALIRGLAALPVLPSMPGTGRRSATTGCSGCGLPSDLRPLAQSLPFSG